MFMYSTYDAVLYCFLQSLIDINKVRLKIRGSSQDKPVKLSGTVNNSLLNDHKTLEAERLKTKNAQKLKFTVTHCCKVALQD